MKVNKFAHKEHVSIACMSTMCGKIYVNDNKVCPLLATDSAPKDPPPNGTVSRTSVYPSPAISSKPALIIKEYTLPVPRLPALNLTCPT